MESILCKEQKSDKLAEDLNSRCNVFVQVSSDTAARTTQRCFLLQPPLLSVPEGNPVRLQHQHHHQDHHEHVHVDAAAHDQDVCQSSVSTG